ncbi:DUF2975 domain-containing protein [Pseudobacillus badius]|uniref:DUF2975 domain-containing protein n=1 Tax=Bacillus badius TaxID=1455 RepID=UPI000597E388|nr:DUF2975 domain-containing protein [Bacillus badius]KIL74640.1 putative membrane protein [Bacillus badius]
MKRITSPVVLHAVLVFGIIVTFILLIGTPMIVTAFFKSQYGLLNSYLVLNVSIYIYICAAPYMISLFKLRKLSSLVIKNTPFSDESVKSLKTIAACSFSEVVLFVACVSALKYSVEFFKYTVWGGPIIVVTFIGVTIGLLCTVLAKLFEVAIEIKTENDQTI